MSSKGRASFRPIDSTPSGLPRFAGEADDLNFKKLIGEDAPIITPDSAINEDAKIGNVNRLSPGTHRGMRTEKPHTVVSGTGGSKVARLARFDSHAVVSDSHFQQTDSGNNSDFLVVVKAGVRVIFRDCIFERKYNAPIAVDPPLPAVPTIRKCFVLVESGGRALFTGCVFRSNLESGAMNGVGTVVQNLSVTAANVIVSNGVNFTTHSHGTTVTHGNEI